MREIPLISTKDWKESVKGMKNLQKPVSSCSVKDYLSADWIAIQQDYCTWKTCKCIWRLLTKKSPPYILCMFHPRGWNVCVVVRFSGQMSIIKVLEDVRQSPRRNVGLYIHVEQRYLHLQREILTFAFTGDIFTFTEGYLYIPTSDRMRQLRLMSVTAS